MEFWEQRRKSNDWLSTDLREESSLFEEAFCFLTEVADKLNSSPTGEFGQICSLTVLKGREYAHGCLSLTLDGNAQAAGAVLRPLVEAFELLKYFRLAPDRVKEVAEDNLPSAGNRAKEIDGDVKFLRDYLNEHASHFSYSDHAVQHLFDLSSGEIKINLSEALKTGKIKLRYNLGSLFTVVVFLIIESVGCLSLTGHEDAEKLADKAEDLKQRGILLFRQQDEEV